MHMPTWIIAHRITVPLQSHDNMALQAQFAQELDELTLCESGWPLLPRHWQILENSSSNQSHLSNFLAPDITCFESFSPFETSYPPPAITYDTLEPFQCIDQNLPLHFGDPQLHRLVSYDSGYNTVVPSPAPGEFYETESAVIVAEHLKQLSGLSTTQASTPATTRPLPARNDPLSPPNTMTSSRILVDSQGCKLSNRPRKTQKVAKRELVKEAEDRIAR